LSSSSLRSPQFIYTLAMTLFFYPGSPLSPRSPSVFRNALDNALHPLPAAFAASFAVATCSRLDRWYITVSRWASARRRPKTRLIAANL